MGSDQSKIQVLNTQSKFLQKHLSVQPTNYVQPFRQFNSQYHKKSSGSQHEAIIKIKAPQQQRIVSLTQQKFNQIEQAYEQKTKNFQIQAIIFDQYYTDRFTYVLKDLQKIKTVLIRQFEAYDTHTFGNIACQVSINQDISNLETKNLLKMNQNYLIENEEIKFENPKTQVLQFQGVSASLAEIIKYRRQNNWQWTQIQFNQLAHDLSSAVFALHQINICHNDIRPENIFYSSNKRCYLIGQFSYATKNALKGNLRSNRASKNYCAPETNSKQQYDLKKADIFSLGNTLLCALYLCNPLNVDQTRTYNSKYRGISGFKAVQEMIKPEDQRKSIEEILKSLPNPKYQNKLMDNMIESLRFKINPRNKNQKMYKCASSDFLKRLGLWEDWRDQVDQMLQSDHSLNKYQTAQLHKQLALIDYCQDQLQQSTLNAKKAAKLYRQMGQDAFAQGNLNEALKNYQNALECSKYYVNKYDIDLAKSLICLSKVHAQKRQQQYSSTLLSQAKDLIIKQSSQDSILYSQMKIKEAQLSKKFFRYQQSLDDLEQALDVAKRMQAINQRSSKLCQAKILTMMAQNEILIAKKMNQNQKGRLEKSQEYLNLSKMIYQSLHQVDCHLELAQNTEVLGLLNVEKRQYEKAKLCFKKSLQMRRWYQQNKNQPLYIHQHGNTLSQLGRCERLMNTQKQEEIYKQALKNQEDALQIFKKVYGSDHTYYSACVLKQMGQLYQSMDQSSQSRECFECSKQILNDLYGENSPYNQIGDIQKMLRN